jgi:membrane protein implicated in regulation of membrane protease activity
MISVVQAFIAFFAAQKTKSFVDFEAKVDKVVEPGRTWRVYHKGVYWPAYSYSGANFQPGDWVRVVGRDGINLVIEPLESEEYV